MLKNTLLAVWKMVWAVIFWPKFSFTSFKMVTSLCKQGVIPKTVIDVGANVGQFAIASAKLFPDVYVYSFEPLPECIDALKKNTCSLGNIKIYPIALGESEGKQEIYVNTHKHSSSFLSLSETHLNAFPHAQEINQVIVNVSTLDLILKDVNLKSPVMLKLDVQGYESHVLKGAEQILKQVDYVVLEASLKPMYENEMLFMDIINFMKEYGFTFQRPIGWLMEPKTNEVLQLDALFTKVIN